MSFEFIPPDFAPFSFFGCLTCYFFFFLFLFLALFWGIVAWEIDRSLVGFLRQIVFYYFLSLVSFLFAFEDRDNELKRILDEERFDHW